MFFNFSFKQSIILDFAQYLILWNVIRKIEKHSVKVEMENLSKVILVSKVTPVDGNFEFVVHSGLFRNTIVKAAII